jgi:PAS domain S-box-containing protein
VTRLRTLGEMLVSAPRRAEVVAGLREAEERLSLAADSAEAGLWTLDYGTGFFWATGRARAIFGYSPDEIITVERLETTVHPSDRERVRGAIERSSRAGELVNVEYRILLDDGSVRWIASRGRPQSGTTGERDRLTGVSIDVTEQRRAEDALRRSEARLASGGDLADLAFYEVDFGECVAYIDERFRKICGVPPEREQGLQPLEFWMEHLHPDDRQRVLRLRQELHSGRRDAISLEYRYLHPPHGQKWIHHLARIAVRDADGRAVVAFGVLRDITERKRAEDEMRDLSQRLIRAHEEERALIEAALTLRPDVIVADVTMPHLNGIDALVQLRQGGNRVPVVFLTMHRDVTFARRALDAGASGFVLKHSAPTELVTAIRAALEGRTYLTPQLAGEVLEAMKQAREKSADPVVSLTPRQREVLHLLAEGRSAKEIAASLGISTRTVEFHKYQTMETLDLHTNAELIHFAIKHGLVEL